MLNHASAIMRAQHSKQKEKTMAHIAINSVQDFADKVENSKTTVIAGFTADWCPHCKKLAPYIQQFADMMPDLTIARVDVDKAEAVSEKYSIMTIPTLCIFKEGKMVASKMVANSQPHEIEAFIKENI